MVVVSFEESCYLWQGGGDGIAHARSIRRLHSGH
jgi:hypothetical protein